MKRFGVVISLLLLFCASVSAQNMQNQIAAIVAKYKDTKGVMSMACNDGVKLNIVKSMLRKEFGEEFANGIKTFAIIYYKGAQRENATRIVGDVKLLTQSLQKINIDNKFKKPNTKASGYILLSKDRQSITDLIVVIDAPSPTVIYIGGKFKAEKI